MEYGFNLLNKPFDQIYHFKDLTRYQGDASKTLKIGCIELFKLKYLEKYQQNNSYLEKQKMLTKNAIIIDDEPDACKLLRDLLAPFKFIQVIGVFTDPQEGLQKVLTVNPDILFLDIQMPEISGIEIIENLRPWMWETEVVFVTAFPDYSLQAAQNNAFDYLLKPVDKSDLEKLVDKLVLKQNGKIKTENYPPNERLLIWSTTGVELVLFKDILYLEADKNYTEVVLISGKRILTSRSLGMHEKKLPEHLFTRISRKHIVNRIYLKSVNFKEKICCLESEKEKVCLGYTRKVSDFIKEH